MLILVLKIIRKLPSNYPAIRQLSFCTGRGRPSVEQNIEAELFRIARQNPAWGYRRIAGALRNLGFKISDSAVANIMRRNVLPPSGTRQNHGMSWREFIQLHCHLIWATDFFTVEAWTCRGLVTFYVLFFIHLKTREVFIGGITASPNGEWMAQVARNVIGFDGALTYCHYLIHDRGSQYTLQFDEIQKSAGIKPIRLPPRAPNLNAFALAISPKNESTLITLALKIIRKLPSNCPAIRQLSFCTGQG